MIEVNNPIPPASPIQTPPQTIPEGQSAASSNKPVKINPILAFAVIFIVYLSAMAGCYYFWTRQNDLALKENQNQPGQQVELMPSPTDQTNSDLQTVISSQPTVDAIPQENSLYLGTYQNKDAIFITDKEKQKYYENGEQKTSVYIGELTTAKTGGYTPFDYKQLISPVRILTNPEKSIYAVNSLVTNKAKSMVYVSLNYLKPGSQYPDLQNSILQIRTDGLQAQQIWAYDIGSDKYGKARGATYLEQVFNDQYLSFVIDDCYACSGSPIGTIILNIITGNERYYEMVGDVEVDLSNNTLSYKNLSPFQQACEPGMGCDNGQKTVMKPSGQTLTDSLP